MRSPSADILDFALELSTHNKERGYLGEYLTMKTFILCSAARFLAAPSKEEPEAEVHKAIGRIVYALLGRPPLTVACPVPNWHAPGIIDEYLGQKLNLEEDTAYKRCHAVVLRFFKEVESIQGFEEDFERWILSVDSVARKYTDLFLGLEN